VINQKIVNMKVAKKTSGIAQFLLHTVVSFTTQ